MLRALVAAQKRKGKLLPGAGLDDMGVGFQVIFADHGLKNRSHFLRLAELATKLFDDAEDGGGAGQRVTRFVFPSEIEAEMKNGGRSSPGGSVCPGRRADRR